MKKKYIILFLFVFFNKVNAQTEFSLLAENEEATYYVKDEKTINVEHFIWIKIISKPTTYKNKKGKLLKKYKGNKMIQFCLNCADKTIRTILYYEYDSSGNVINSSEEESEVSQIIPETFGEMYFKYACE